MGAIMRMVPIPRGVVTTFVLSALLHQTPGAACGQQVADPKFDASVAKPAYTDRHPKVLFDEAHYNFHTSDGWYKPFVDLAKHDGYRVTANKEKFAKKSLAGFNLLVIANGADIGLPLHPRQHHPRHPSLHRRGERLGPARQHHRRPTFRAEGPAPSTNSSGRLLPS